MKPPLKEIKRILDYLWKDEKRNFEATDKKDGHIFKDIQKVKTWLSQMSDKGYWTKLFKKIDYD